MTPEERARKLLEGMYGMTFPYTFDRPVRIAFEITPEGMEELIAAAIRAAVEEEREACAKIASDSGRAHWDDLGDWIADLIRARATPSPQTVEE